MATKKSEKSAEIKLDLLSSDGKKKSELSLTPKESYLKNRSATIHDVVVMHQSNRRRGTASVKTRAEVNKTGRKPWKQKGTGNARAGTAGSPLWRGGGVAHGPIPRDWSYQVPKKMRRLAFANSVVRKMQDKEVVVIEELKVKEPKTKLAAQLLAKINDGKSVLLVTLQADPILNRAVRNIPRVGITTVTNLNTLDVLKYQKLVLSKEVFEQLATLLEGEKK